MRRTVMFVGIALLLVTAPAAHTEIAPASAWQTRETPVYSDPDDNWAKDPSIIKAGDTYYMYYTSANPWQDTGEGGKGEPRIDYATSPDGLTWTRQGVAIEKGKEGEWDGKRPQAPAKPILKDGVYYMYYAGAGDRVYIGYATSTDLRRWKKHPGNPVIRYGGKCNDPYVYLEDGIYHLFYDDGAEQVYYATSTNLKDWSSTPVQTGAVGEGNIVLKDQGVYTMLTAVGHSHRGEYYKSWTSRSLTGFVDRGKIRIKVPAWASGAFGHGDVVCRDNQYWLYFQGTSDGGKTFQIGLAKHPARPIGLDDDN
jgi:hypothetical protein